jgi:hypothetical protein
MGKETKATAIQDAVRENDPLYLFRYEGLDAPTFLEHCKQVFGDRRFVWLQDLTRFCEEQGLV